MQWIAPSENDAAPLKEVEALNEELGTLNTQARELEQTIASNVAEILEA